MNGKRLGVVKGSTGEEYLSQEHLAILVERYASSKELFSHLKEGGLDAIVHDFATLH